MAELEQRLADLAAFIAWPETPRLAGREPRPAVSPAPRGWPVGPLPIRRLARPVAVAAAAVLCVALALEAYPPSRGAIADWVNLHVLLKPVKSMPIIVSPAPPGPLGRNLGFGPASSLGQAKRDVGWRVLVPASLGAPDEVYFQAAPSGPSGGEVTLVYGARPGIPTAGQTGVAVLITEARGSVDENFFGKSLGPGTTLESVSVGGAPGFWIAGQPHVFFLIDAHGTVVAETLRLATNTLIVDEGGTIVRIEGDLTLAQAEQIAESLA